VKALWHKKQSAAARTAIHHDNGRRSPVGDLASLFMVLLLNAFWRDKWGNLIHE